tara:strand:+ start:15191 stop:15565 length:375 start_codon:yes stop_codon:yes gene_type:complete
MDEVISRAKRMGGGLIAILFILLIFGGNFLTTIFDATIFHVMPLIFLVFALVMAILYESLNSRKVSLEFLHERKNDDFTDEELETIKRAIEGMDNSLDVALGVGVISMTLGLIGLFSLDSITIY